MDLSNEEKKGQELLEKLIAKAWDDDNFKNELLNNPNNAIEKVAGKKFVSEKRIIVTDQSNPNCTYINIPAKIDASDLELSEDQLEKVAGGFMIPPKWLIKGAIVAAAPYVALYNAVTK